MGGHQAGIILYDITDIATSKTVMAKRLRTGVENTTVKYGEQVTRYTISLGLADISADMKNCKDWLSAADQALYQSKHAGRKRLHPRRCITGVAGGWRIRVLHISLAYPVLTVKLRQVFVYGRIGVRHHLRPLKKNLTDDRKEFRW